MVKFRSETCKLVLSLVMTFLENILYHEPPTHLISSLKIERDGISYSTVTSDCDLEGYVRLNLCRAGPSGGNKDRKKRFGQK